MRRLVLGMGVITALSLIVMSVAFADVFHSGTTNALTGDDYAASGGQADTDFPKTPDTLDLERTSRDPRL